MKKQIIKLFILICVSLFMSSCADSQPGKQLKGDLVFEYHEIGDPSIIHETRVFPASTWLVESLPSSEFMASFGTFLIPIAIIPPFIIDCIVYPFKLGYCSMLIPETSTE